MFAVHLIKEEEHLISMRVARLGNPLNQSTGCGERVKQAPKHGYPLERIAASLRASHEAVPVVRLSMKSDVFNRRSGFRPLLRPFHERLSDFLQEGLEE